MNCFTDNQMAARIVQVGSMHFNLHILASNIFSFRSHHGINLEIDWIPRSLNEKADYISKIVHYDDWELFPKFSSYRIIDGVPIPLTVLLRFTITKFQDSFLGSGTQVHLEWTRFCKPGKAKIVGWYLQSPSCRGCSSFSHSRAQGTSATFWPLLIRTFWGFVVDYQFLEGALSVRQGRNSNSLLGSPSWSGHIIAMRLVFHSILVMAFGHFFIGCAACV